MRLGGSPVTASDAIGSFLTLQAEWLASRALPLYLSHTSVVIVSLYSSSLLIDVFSSGKDCLILSPWYAVLNTKPVVTQQTPCSEHLLTETSWNSQTVPKLS